MSGLESRLVSERLRTQANGSDCQAHPGAGGPGGSSRPPRRTNAVAENLQEAKPRAVSPSIRSVLAKRELARVDDTQEPRWMVPDRPPHSARRFYWAADPPTDTVGANQP